MNLFIDTNVLLSFYHFSSDDLEELRKLVVLVREGKVVLLLPEQVIIEFRRNRANKIADALKRLRSQSLKVQYPQLAREYDEYEALRTLQNNFEQLHKKLVQRIEEDVATHNLKADQIINELFQHARVISISQQLLEQARLRKELGNPPGKKDSLGDAIIWEALLQDAPDDEDLHFVTEDSDYLSPLDPGSFDPFLLEEWREAKRSTLIFYPRLSSFFEERFPEIALASELEKELLIRDLANSPTFADTHRIIARLSKFSDFTPAQLNAIVAAAITNNQVYWIIGDHDVNKFLREVISGRESLIDPDNLRRLQDLLGETEEKEYIPF